MFARFLVVLGVPFFGAIAGYSSEQLSCDYFIVSEDARMAQISDIHTTKIIADGSNSYSTINYLKKKLASNPEKLWVTKEKGAFVYE